MIFLQLYLFNPSISLSRISEAFPKKEFFLFRFSFSTQFSAVRVLVSIKSNDSMFLSGLIIESY